MGRPETCAVTHLGALPDSNQLPSDEPDMVRVSDHPMTHSHISSDRRPTRGPHTPVQIMMTHPTTGGLTHMRIIVECVQNFLSDPALASRTKRSNDDRPPAGSVGEGATFLRC
eukprot:GILI01020555.1.p2 GENE.GILI01020555.1~~GILI01020555.1.p2  ORF type:complete len:113 (+),score=2.96 GILI01020555.1:442-780(+)